MTITHKPSLIAGAMFGALAFASAAGAATTCQPDTLYFRTTQWLNPLDFTVSVTDPSGTIVSSAPVEPALNAGNVPAPITLPTEGGLLWKSVEVTPGFKIKKVLVCSNYPNPTQPVPGIGVTLKQPFGSASIPALAFERMSAKKPGCAVYTVTGTMDELGNPGLPIDPRISPTTLVVTTPQNPLGDITAIGLRLQANPNSPLWTFLPYHQHAYLTGRGQGHNNTVALTSGPADVCDIPASVEFSDLDDTADFVPTLPSASAGSILVPGKPGKKK